MYAAEGGSCHAACEREIMIIRIIQIRDSVRAQGDVWVDNEGGTTEGWESSFLSSATPSGEPFLLLGRRLRF